MGRMKRQRRYKACDPFAVNKKGAAKEDKYDLPPKGNEDDHFKETKSFKKFQLSIQRAMSKEKVNRNSKQNLGFTKNVLKESSKKLKDKSEETNLEKLPHETKNQYFQRLDQNIHDAINTTMIETKTLRKKRKIHLKTRSEKKKMKKQSTIVESDLILKDTFKFGETVNAPPVITAAPRNTPTTSNKFQHLKLTSILENDVNKVSKSNQKERSVSEKESLEVERQRAIDAYRLMKKRKVARYGT